MDILTLGNSAFLFAFMIIVYFPFIPIYLQQVHFGANLVYAVPQETKRKSTTNQTACIAIPMEPSAS